MPIDKSIQDKVLKIAANKAVNNKTKLAIRKQFYVLKQNELDIEAVTDEFNTKVSEFDVILNEILGQIQNVPQLDTVDEAIMQRPQQVITPQRAQQKPPMVMDNSLDDSEDEIIMPQQEVPKIPGIKVRMQEEVQNGEEDTDFEVPFESEEK
jgi:hypothetical protein